MKRIKNLITQSPNNLAHVALFIALDIVLYFIYIRFLQCMRASMAVCCVFLCQYKNWIGLNAMLNSVVLMFTVFKWPQTGEKKGSTHLLWIVFCVFIFNTVRRKWLFCTDLVSMSFFTLTAKARHLFLLFSSVNINTAAAEQGNRRHYHQCMDLCLLGNEWV